MNRSHRFVLLVALAAVMATGCGSANSSGSTARSSGATASSASPASTPNTTEALCASVASLQKSLNDLQRIDVVHDGVDAAKQQLDAVVADLQQVITESRGHYGPQVDTLQADLGALKSTRQTAQASPSPDNRAAVATAVRTLANDVSAFAQNVSPQC